MPVFEYKKTRWTCNTCSNKVDMPIEDASPPAYQWSRLSIRGQEDKCFCSKPCLILWVDKWLN